MRGWVVHPFIQGHSSFRDLILMLFRLAFVDLKGFDFNRMNLQRYGYTGRYGLA
jgi:hypothetical protein